MSQGDIIDTMLGWVFELFSWIFKMLLQFVISIVKGIFNLLSMGVKALFNKNTAIPPE